MGAGCPVSFGQQAASGFRGRSSGSSYSSVAYVDGPVVRFSSWGLTRALRWVPAMGTWWRQREWNSELASIWGQVVEPVVAA